MSGSSAPKSASQHFYRFFYAVIILMLSFAGVVYWIFVSEWLPDYIVKQTVTALSGKNKLKIEIAGFKGSLQKGMSIESLTLQKAPDYRLTAEKCKIEIEYSKVTEGALNLFVDLQSLKIDGSKPVPPAVGSLPSLSSLGCFAGMPANLRISGLHVGKIEYRPWQDFPLTVCASETSLTPSDNKEGLELSASVSLLTGDLHFESRTLGTAVLTGKTDRRLKKFEGRVKLNVIGQNIESELNYVQKKGAAEVSGYIADTELNITPVTMWLLPLWQEKFPFGFDGAVSLAGAWLYNQRTGFLGNFSGKINKLRMMAQGFFITVFELNSEWKYSGDTLQITDKGSTFLGFDASLNGDIERLPAKDRKWNLNAKCEKIDAAKLIAGLPWIVASSFSLPQCVGSACLTAEIRAHRPEVFARLSLDKLKAADDKMPFVTGQIDYRLGQSGDWRTDGALTCSFKELPPLLADFSCHQALFSSVYSKLSSKSVVSNQFEYTFSGGSIENFKLKGSVNINDFSCPVNGLWNDGTGILNITVYDSENNALKFSKDGIPLLNLLLAQ